MASTTSEARSSAYERAVRAAFPDSQNDLSVPGTRTELYLARVRQLVRERTALVRCFLAVLGAVTAFGMYASLRLLREDPSSEYVVWTFVFVVLVNAGVVLIPARGVRDQFTTSYASSRGLARIVTSIVPSRTPLLTQPSGRWTLVLRGRIWECTAVLGTFTYQGNVDVWFTKTVLRVELPDAVGARYAGVFVSERASTTQKAVAASRISGSRAVALESATLHDRYELRVHANQDDLALYELFSPVFINELATGPHITWQQVGTELVFHRDATSNAYELDRFVIDAGPVIQRYLEEWR